MSYMVRIDRTDGSRGYVGPIRSDKQAERERAAWADAFGYVVSVHETADVRTDVRAFDKARREDRRYVPAVPA